MKYIHEDIGGEYACQRISQEENEVSSMRTGRTRRMRRTQRKTRWKTVHGGYYSVVGMNNVEYVTWMSFREVSSSGLKIRMDGLGRRQRGCWKKCRCLLRMCNG